MCIWWHDLWLLLLFSYRVVMRLIGCNPIVFDSMMMTTTHLDDDDKQTRCISNTRFLQTYRVDMFTRSWPCCWPSLISVTMFNDCFHSWSHAYHRGLHHACSCRNCNCCSALPVSWSSWNSSRCHCHNGIWYHSWPCCNPFEWKYAVFCLWQSQPTKEAKLIEYDREHARKCVIDDWLDPIPRFPDKKFEGTFCLKHNIADTMINHLTKYDTFWRQTVCRAGKPSISPMSSFFVRRRCCATVSLLVPSMIIFKWVKPPPGDICQSWHQVWYGAMLLLIFTWGSQQSQMQGI